MDKSQKSEVKLHVRNAETGFTSLGGYPVYTVMQDGGCLCPKCVKENRRRIYLETVTYQTDPAWVIRESAVNWEDEHLTCDNCDEQIDPAYPSDLYRINKRFGSSDVVEEETHTLIRYTLGSHFAPYLINGDDSGLEEGEAEGLEEYLKSAGLTRARG